MAVYVLYLIGPISICLPVFWGAFQVATIEETMKILAIPFVLPIWVSILPWIIGVVTAYAYRLVQKSEGYAHNHYRWQIRAFWLMLPFCVMEMLSVLLIIKLPLSGDSFWSDVLGAGVLTLFATPTVVWIWVLCQCARGLMLWSKQKPVPNSLQVLTFRSILIWGLIVSSIFLLFFIIVLNSQDPDAPTVSASNVAAASFARMILGGYLVLRLFMFIPFHPLLKFIEQNFTDNAAEWLILLGVCILGIYLYRFLRSLLLLLSKK